MKKTNKLLLTLLFGLPIASAHAKIIQCPSSTEFVNIGDSMQQVIAKCGNPTKHVSLKAPQPQAESNWQYLLPGSPGFLAKGFLVIFSDNKVKQIVSGNNELMDSVQCSRGATITVGNSKAEVSKACGVPYYKREHVPPSEGEHAQPAQEHLIYKTRNYLPTQTFVFENNKLEDVITDEHS